MCSNSKKVHLVSLGCDKNLADSEKTLGLFVDNGYEYTDDASEADVIVVNTCCFIRDAKTESIETLIEMADLKTALLNGEDLRANDELAKHADWADGFMKRHPEFSADNAEEIIRDEIGQVFAKVLECAGVYKCTAEGREHLKKFLTEVQNG